VIRITWRGFGILTAAVAVGVLTFLVALMSKVAADDPSSTARARPPNIVLILTDDQRADTLEHMPIVQRELVARGVSFTRAYATTPHCCPSRASLLTGLYAHHHGVLRNEGSHGGWRAFDDQSTVATWLQSAGMRTLLAGKYLNLYRSYAVPTGWDDWFAIWDTGRKFHDFTVNQNGNAIFYPDREALYSARVLREHVLDLIRNSASDTLFVYLAFDGPHAPAEPARRDRGKFADLQAPRLPSFNEADVHDKPGWVQALPPLDTGDIRRLDTLYRRQLETLQIIDRSVGMLIEELRASGHLENTWLIFASDNGLSMGEHRYGPHKSCGYEECVRIPLVIAPPPLLAAELRLPREDDRLVALMDLAPTFAEIAGIRAGHPVDGMSLLPLLDGKETAWRSALGLELWASASETSFQGIVTRDWKHLRYETGEEELYDLVNDPYELENLALLTGPHILVAELSEQLKEIMGEPPRSP
jgi:arylsulfatase A-like enzyme